MLNCAFDANGLSDCTVFTISMAGRGLVQFKWQNIGFIEVAFVVFFGSFVKFLGFFDGNRDLFEFGV